jgi:hypothetical protein
MDIFASRQASETGAGCKKETSMRSRIPSFDLLTKNVLAAAGFAAMLLMPVIISAQTPAAKASQSAGAKGKKWRNPRGDPDLQGSWTNAKTTPLQRPAKYQGREFLTPGEKAEQDSETSP